MAIVTIPALKAENNALFTLGINKAITPTRVNTFVTDVIDTLLGVFVVGNVINTAVLQNTNGANIASASGAVAFGQSTTASGVNSNASGTSTRATGADSHAEGSNNTASGAQSHAEGSSNVASGASSHAEGSTSTAIGISSHAEGGSAYADGIAAHAEGGSTWATGAYSHTEGSNTRTTAGGNSAHAEGSTTTASASNAHAEGNSSTASGSNSHAEGQNTTSSGVDSHAEGNGTTASGLNSHSEGYNTLAVGISTSAGGQSSRAMLNSSFARSSDMTLIPGDSQCGGVHLKTNTTNATPGLLKIGNTAYDIVIPLDSTWQFNLSILATQKTTSGVGAIGDSSSFYFQGAIKNLAGTLSLVGAIGGGRQSFDAAAGSWIVSLAVDNTLKSLAITVTGETSKDIVWGGRIDMVQIGFRNFNGS
jgi:hypothetical protein